MGQKVNPISLRLEKTNRHFDSCWYDDYNYTDLLLQDLKIKNYLKIVLNQIKYPEGRILLENLPNKSNINLFYCNPSLSRQKKNKTFQLQNIKKSYPLKVLDTRKGYDTSKGYEGDDTSKGYEGIQMPSTKDNNNKKNKSPKNAFKGFSFPKQKYWKDEFTLAQQTLKGYKRYEAWKNNLYPSNVPLYDSKKVRDTSKGYVTRKGHNTIQGPPNLPAEGIQSVPPRDTKVFSLTTQGRDTILLNSYKQEVKSNIKQILLQFILKGKGDDEERENINRYEKKVFSLPEKIRRGGDTSKGYEGQHTSKGLAFEKKGMDKKWVRERFFTRYLLAQLYGKFLQNKNVYSVDGLRTLYQWLIFFQERNRLTKDSFCTPSLLNSLLHTQNMQKRSTSKVKGYDEGLISYDTSKGYDTYPLKGHDTKKGHDTYPLKEHDVSYPSLHLQVKDTLSLPRQMGGIPRGLYSSNKVYKSYLEFILCKQYHTFFNLFFFRSGTEKQGALFLVEDIIYYLERKIPFRRIKSQILKEIPRCISIRGIRITCSGRVGGRSKKAQRSKTQSVKIGQTPLGVFSSKIDFASKSALTRFGLIGIKVWVCYQ